MAITYGARSVLHVETGGSIAEAVGGIAVVVLAIISLAAAATSGLLVAIAVIVLGVAFLAEGGAVAAEYSRLMSMDTGAGAAAKLEMGGGTTLELLGGVGLAVLGILSVIGLVADILVPAAIITGGAVIILSSGMLLEMNEFRIRLPGFPETHRGLARTSVSGAVAIQLLAGSAAIVLGILGLVEGTFAFSEIGLLVLGAALAIGATTLTGVLVRIFAH